MKICEYGCGQEAKHYFPTAKKWCCSKNWRQCLVKRREHSIRIKEKWKDPESGLNSISRREKMSESKKGKDPWNKGKTGVFSEEALRRMSEARKDKKRSKETRKKISISGNLTIEKIKDKYKTFSSEEEMRYNPDKPKEKEIQVHCKNHLCKNSKEKSGWFTPTKNQFKNRKDQLERQDGNDGSFFYCSQKCKDICPLYNLHRDPFKNTELPYTQEEKNIFNREVLKRQKEEDGHNSCEKCESTENLHVHHEKPVKTHPHLALDPDNGIVLCEKCHYKYGHKIGTECSTGNLANKIC